MNILKVECKDIIYPPNKILQRKTDLSSTPIIHDHLLFLDFNKYGQSIVGSSSLNRTLWEGTLLYFENEQNLEKLRFTQHYIGLTASDGKFLNSDTIILAEDDGHLNVLKCSKKKNSIESVKRLKETDRVPRIAVWNNEKCFLTSSGTSLTVWDIIGEKPSHRFSNHHTEFVNCVDTIKNNNNLFVSTAEDLKCCLWDLRNPNPATVLYKSDQLHVASVACNQNDTNYVAIGNEDGNVRLLDRRNSGQAVSGANGNFYVHRLIFDESGKLAVCGDAKKIVVWKCSNEKFDCIYSDGVKHRGIVRGLGWHKTDLYSCGFDKQVVRHIL